MAKDKQPHKRVTNKLVGLDVVEVSFVDAPANEKPWFIVKRKGEIGMDELLKALKALTGKDLSEDQKISLEKMGPDVHKRISSAVELLTKYKDDLPKDLFDAVLEVAGLVVEKGAAATPPEPVDLKPVLESLAKITANQTTMTETLAKLADAVAKGSGATMTPGAGGVTPGSGTVEGEKVTMTMQELQTMVDEAIKQAVAEGAK